MANIFLDLPVPIANGVGAPVDVSGMGETKTVTYQGDLFAAVEVQVSGDGVNFEPLYTFSATSQAAGTQKLKRTFTVAARFMRARVSNFRAGTTANMDVGANDNGTSFVTPAVPAGAGAGAGIDVSALGTFNTVYVAGTFTGNVVIQISDDDIDYSPCMSFARVGGQKSKEFAAAFVRVVRDSVQPSAPGLPVVTVVATNDPASSSSVIPPLVSNQFLRSNAAATDLVFFDLFGSTNLWTAEQTHSANIVPSADDAYNLGSRTGPFRWADVVSNLITGWGGDTFPTVPAGQSGGVFGLNTGPGTEDVDFGGGLYEPIFLAAKAETTAAGAVAQVNHPSGGSVMMGSAFASSGRAEILSNASAYGMFIGGYAFMYGGGGTTRIQGGPGGSGSFLWAYVAKTGVGLSVARANGVGSFVQGRIQGSGTHTLQTTAAGCFAQGVPEGTGSSIIEAISAGGFAQGRALNGGLVRASGNGAFAQGFSNAAAGSIVASGNGSFAKGTSNANTVEATASGAFAMGNANTGDISATAINAAQFGPGANSQADSVQVGDAGLRLNGVAGVPAGLQNGDFWVAGGSVYVRTGGVTKNLDAI